MRVDHKKALDVVGAVATQTEFPIFQKLLQLWHVWPETHGRALMREDLDFLDDKEWKPHLAIIDIIRDGSDGRFRLMGRSFVEGLGRNATGECFSSLPHCVLKSNYRPVMTHITHKAIPLYVEPTVFALTPRRSNVVEQLHLPINILDGRPHMILSAIHLIKPQSEGGSVPYPTAAA